MTFTYTENLLLDRDFVRFHSGDVIEAESMLSDELIASLVANTGSRERAVLAALKHKIVRLSQPNFKADWLSVDNAEAVKSLMSLLVEKRAEFGIAKLSATTTHVYRADSATTSEPDYTDGRP